MSATTDPFSPPPFAFDPDDRRTYLLMVFTRTPFVPFALRTQTGTKINDFPPKTGIYALYLNDQPLGSVLDESALTGTAMSPENLEALNFQLVYVGKTSAGGTLRDRLRTHYNKISRRQNISVERLLCRYLAIPLDWNVLFAEQNLIPAREITPTPPPPWNTNGFGSNVPGAGRPGKRAKPATHFDVLFPLREGVEPSADDESE